MASFLQTQLHNISTHHYIFRRSAGFNKKKAVAKVKKESKKHENPSVIEAEANIVAKRFTNKAISRMQSRYKSDSQKQKVTKDDFLVLSDEARKEVLNNYRKRGIYDIVVIDVLKEDVEGKSLDEVKRIITQHVQKYVDYANSQEGQKFDVKILPLYPILCLRIL